jgi:hypothetical protein
MNIELVVRRGSLCYYIKMVTNGWLVFWRCGGKTDTSGIYPTKIEADKACFSYASP